MPNKTQQLTVHRASSTQMNNLILYSVGCHKASPVYKSIKYFVFELYAYFLSSLPAARLPWVCDFALNKLAGTACVFDEDAMLLLGSSI